MYKIEDYLKYYKDTSIKDISLNDLDLAVFAIFAYLPLKPFKGKKKIEDILLELNDIKNSLSLGGMTSYAITLINLINKSIRYKNIKFYNLVSIVDANTQFEAIKIKFNKYSIISYKGTNNSIIGWKENFRLSYMYPSYTQAMAKKYFLDNINIFDRNIYLVGHSKGGNLAISTSMEVSNKRIKRIVNYDGPGLLDNEFNSEKFNNIKDRLVNYLPENSVIGILMNNTNYHYVKADGFGFTCHYMNNWYTYGTMFEESKLSKTSQKLHDNNVESLKVAKKSELEKVIETFFGVVENNGINKFSDIHKMNKTTLLKTINQLKGVSKETKEYFFNSIKLFFMPKRGKK